MFKRYMPDLLVFYKKKKYISSFFPPVTWMIYCYPASARVEKHCSSPISFLYVLWSLCRQNLELRQIHCHQKCHLAHCPSSLLWPSLMGLLRLKLLEALQKYKNNRIKTLYCDHSLI